MRKNSLFFLVFVAGLLYSWQLAVLMAAGGFFLLALTPDGAFGESKVEHQLDDLIHDMGLLYRDVHAWRSAFEEKVAREERRRLRSKPEDVEHQD